MTTTFVVPLIDTLSGEFNFEGSLSAEEYSKMLMDNFKNNYNSVNTLVNEIKSGVHVNTNDHFLEVEDKYIFSKTQAILLDSNYNDISINYLDSLVSTEKRFTLRVNILPSTMDDNAQEEMNYWLDDSDMVLNDASLDKRAMLLSLPIKDFLIDTGDKIYRICDCKVLDIDNTDTKKYPFSFVLLVDKIIYY